MSKKDYDRNYQKTRCKQYKLLLHKKIDKDIIDYLDSLPNRAGMLKILIRREIKRGGD